VQSHTHIAHSPHLTIKIDLGFLRHKKNCSQTVLTWHSSTLSQLCVFQSCSSSPLISVELAWTLYTSLQWVCRGLIQGTVNPRIKLKNKAGTDKGVA